MGSYTDYGELLAEYRRVQTRHVKEIRDEIKRLRQDLGDDFPISDRLAEQLNYDLVKYPLVEGRKYKYSIWGEELLLTNFKWELPTPDNDVPCKKLIELDAIDFIKGRQCNTIHIPEGEDSEWLINTISRK